MTFDLNELLGLAARGAGFSESRIADISQGNGGWRPHVNEGEALRLAGYIGAELSICLPASTSIAKVRFGEELLVKHVSHEKLGVDGATCLVITQLAAEVGLRKKAAL